MRWIARVWLILVLALASSSAFADEIRPMALDLVEQQTGQWHLSWKQPVLNRAAPVIRPVPPANCQLLGEPIIRQANAALLGTVQLQCDGPLGGESVSVPGLTGQSDALLRVQPLDGPTQSLRLTTDQPTATILSEPGTWQVFQTYVVIGVEHILMGWDHLLFVIALVLLVKKGWSVVGAATAFTVAHSVTLATSVLGYAGLPQAPVEALIALSIIFLAVELTSERGTSWTRRWPWIVAFGFGLLHGFGFAGALSEIGLPYGEVPAALLAFNLGVEAGQIVVIAIVLSTRWLIQRFAPKTEQPAVRIAAYATGIIASYWLLDRVLGW